MKCNRSFDYENNVAENVLSNRAYDKIVHDHTWMNTLDEMLFESYK